MNSNTRGRPIQSDSNGKPIVFLFGNQVGTKDMPKFVQEFNYRKVGRSLKHRFFYNRKVDTGRHIQSFGVKLAAAIRHAN